VQELGIISSSCSSLSSKSSSSSFHFFFEAASFFGPSLFLDARLGVSFKHSRTSFCPFEFYQYDVYDILEIFSYMTFQNFLVKLYHPSNIPSHSISFSFWFRFIITTTLMKFFSLSLWFPKAFAHPENQWEEKDEWVIIKKWISSFQQIQSPISSLSSSSLMDFILQFSVFELHLDDLVSSDYGSIWIQGANFIFNSGSFFFKSSWIWVLGLFGRFLVLLLLRERIPNLGSIFFIFII